MSHDSRKVKGVTLLFSSDTFDNSTGADLCTHIYFYSKTLKKYLVDFVLSLLLLRSM